MLNLQIPELKDFMSKLLISDLFHHYLVKEVSITMGNQFFIDGRLRKEFFSTEEAEVIQAGDRQYSTWEELKPHCFAMMKGKKPPLAFHMIFCLDHAGIEQFLSYNQLPFSAQDIQGLYLNLKFQNGILTCTTGSFLNQFTMDKSHEHAWDAEVSRFFHQNGILTEIL